MELSLMQLPPYIVFSLNYKWKWVEGENKFTWKTTEIRKLFNTILVDILN